MRSNPSLKVTKPLISSVHSKTHERCARFFAINISFKNKVKKHFSIFLYITRVLQLLFLVASYIYVIFSLLCFLITSQHRYTTPLQQFYGIGNITYLASKDDSSRLKFAMDYIRIMYFRADRLFKGYKVRKEAIPVVVLFFGGEMFKIW